MVEDPYNNRLVSFRGGVPALIIHQVAVHTNISIKWKTPYIHIYYNNDNTMFKLFLRGISTKWHFMVIG